LAKICRFFRNRFKYCGTGGLPILMLSIHSQ
jgi:hypothetical protein